MAIEKLIELEKGLLTEVNKVIAQFINESLNTVVNEFGVFHRQEPEFNIFSKGLDADDFNYISYFVVPIDIETRVVLPKTYLSDTERCRDITAYSEFLTKLECDEYYRKLTSVEKLAKLIETRTGGGKVYYTLTSRTPLNGSPEFLIENVEYIDDVAYLIATFFSN
jgi:hypothetical protein